MPFIDTPRLRFHYRTQGDPDGLPMLLLHGSFASGRWWEPFLSILPKEILAVVPDLRGCGESDQTDTGYAIDEQAEDVHSLVEALGWDGFDLVGHSSSGAVAVEYAMRYAHTLHSLILVSSAPVEGVRTPLEAYPVLESLRTERELLGRALRNLMPSLADSAVHQPFIEQLVTDAQSMAPAAFTAVARALDHWDRFQDAGQLTLPTLLIWGDQDTIVDHATTVRSLIAIPGANNLEILRNVGHSPMIEAPVALAERIIDFISEEFDEFEEIRGSMEEGKSNTDLTDKTDF